MPLTPQHRAFLINEQIIGPAVINFAFNAADGYWMFRPFAPIPMWALPGVALDLLGVLPGLPFLLTLITTPIVRRAVRKGKVAPLPHGPAAYPLLRWLPHGLWKRSFYLGMASWLLFGPLVLAALWLAGDRMELTTFWIVKGSLCGVLAAIVAPIAAFYTLAQESASVPAAAPADRATAIAPQPAL